MKSIGVWFGVNKNGWVATFCDTPTRNTSNGRWEGKFPFVNSDIYNQICIICKKSKMTWEHDIEYIELQLE